MTVVFADINVYVRGHGKFAFSAQMVHNRIEHIVASNTVFAYTCDEIEDMLADHDLLQEALRDVKYMCGEDIYESCYGGAF